MKLFKKAVALTLSVALLSIGTAGIKSYAIGIPTETTGTPVYWNYSDYSHGSYVPKSGYVSTRFFDYPSTQDTAKTYVNIPLDQYNVTNILDYNNGGDNPGTAADGEYCYLTCDVTHVRSGSNDMMSAYSVSSTLPNPKTDIENDDFFGSRNEESEVVALGSVSVGTYNMVTYWDDYRSGGSTDNGTWQCQFGMSKSGMFDYNNVLISDVVQAIVYFGNTSGMP